MKFQGSLACLLLALCLGSGQAGPLLSAGGSAEAGVGEAIGHRVGEAISHGIGEAIGQGAGEAADSGVREAMGRVGDAFGPRVGEAVHEGFEEAAHALGNTGSEAGRQAESIIRHGMDAAHSSWQGVPGNNGASVSGWEGAGNGGLWAAGLGMSGTG